MVKILKNYLNNKVLLASFIEVTLLLNSVIVKILPVSILGVFVRVKFNLIHGLLLHIAYCFRICGFYIVFADVLGHEYYEFFFYLYFYLYQFFVLRND